jgi:proteasome lid subunit RPN8/RPN11
VYPEEGCGLLLGTIDPTIVNAITIANSITTVHQVIATENSWNKSHNTSEPDRSTRDRYEIDPREMLAAMKSARETNLELVGIYHSHPDHPAIPSECDRRLAWPHYIYVICSIDRASVSTTTAWQLDEQQQFQAMPIDIP